jgi:PAS domain S-box-containing protein
MIIATECEVSLDRFQKAAMHTLYWHASDDLCWIIGADDRLLYVTPQVETVLGMSCEDLKNVHETTMLDPGEKAKLAEAITQCRATGQDQAVDGILTRYAKLPGGKVEPMHISLQHQCLRCVGGDPRGITGRSQNPKNEPDFQIERKRRTRYRRMGKLHQCGTHPREIIPDWVLHEDATSARHDAGVENDFLYSANRFVWCKVRNVGPFFSRRDEALQNANGNRRCTTVRPFKSQTYSTIDIDIDIVDR